MAIGGCQSSGDMQICGLSLSAINQVWQHKIETAV